MRFSLFSLILLSLFILAGCGNDQPILGEWRLADMDIEKAIKHIPDDQKDMARSLMSNNFRKMKGKMKVVFEDKGKIRLENPTNSGSTNVVTGTWTLSEDQKKLTTVIDGKTDYLHIIRLNDEELIIGMVLSGQGQVDMTFRHE